jgi:hypothetical protein
MLQILMGRRPPLRRGKIKNLFMKCTFHYATSALKKLHTPAPIRLAVEFEQTAMGTSENIPPASVTPAVHPPVATIRLRIVKLK